MKFINLFEFVGKIFDGFSAGFKQGDPLSCDLFNFLLESVLRKAGVHRNGTIFYKSVQLLAYADDIDIIGRTIGDVNADCYRTGVYKNGSVGK